MRAKFNQLLAEMYASPEYAASRSSNDGGSGVSNTKTKTGTQFSAAQQKRLTRKVMQRVEERLEKLAGNDGSSTSERAKQFAANNRLPEEFVRGFDIPPRLVNEKDLPPATIAAAMNEMAGEEIATGHSVSLRQRSDRETDSYGAQANAVADGETDTRVEQINTMDAQSARRIVRAYQDTRSVGNPGAHMSDVLGSE